MKLKREYKIGIYAIIVLVTFILGVNFIKGRDIFRKHRKFYAVYNDIGGLVEASTITINGLNVGNVSDIHFTDDTSGNILVELTLYKSNLSLAGLGQHLPFNCLQMPIGSKKI